MRNFVLRFGIFGGCISIALGLINWFFIAQSFGSGASQVIGYLSIIVALMCVPLGIKYFRDKLNNGAVSFREGIGIGMGITLVMGVVSFFYSVTFFLIEGDNFQEWQEQGMTPVELDEFRAQLAAMPEFANGPWFQALILFVMILIIGTIINLASSMWLKTADVSTP